MDPLTAKQCEELRQLLVALREELQGLLQRSEAGAKPVDLDQPIGRLSRMDAMQQQSMVQANRRAAQQRIGQVELALRRLAEAEYGICTQCEENIGFARLTARPEATVCIACLKQSET